jgi:hypothetical protein
MGVLLFPEALRKHLYGSLSAPLLYGTAYLEKWHFTFEYVIGKPDDNRDSCQSSGFHAKIAFWYYGPESLRAIELHVGAAYTG